MELFLTGELHQHSADRVLATILFADIAQSTARAADLGDFRFAQGRIPESVR